MQLLPFLPWYPVYGGLLLFSAILLAIWIILQIEKSRELSLVKLIISIVFMALATGLGIQLILVAIGI